MEHKISQIFKFDLKFVTEGHYRVHQTIWLQKKKKNLRFIHIPMCMKIFLKNAFLKYFWTQLIWPHYWLMNYLYRVTKTEQSEQER